MTDTKTHMIKKQTIKELVDRVNKLQRYDIEHRSSGWETSSAMSEDDLGDYIRIEDLAPLIGCLYSYGCSKLVIGE